jgi:hypothetical protein
MMWNFLKKCWPLPIHGALQPHRWFQSPTRRTYRRCEAIRPQRTRLLLEELEDRTVPTVLDLTGSTQEGFINGALFRASTTSPGGSGVVQPFLRVTNPGNNTTEEGYNTDFRPVGNNSPDPVLKDIAGNTAKYCQSVSASAPPIVTIGGVAYREFTVGINQNGTPISLDSLQIFLGTAPNLTSTGFNSSGQLTGLGTLVYNMAVGPDGPSTVLMKSGSGNDLDYIVDIPVSDFTGSNPYLYLYCHFGGYQSPNFAANDGFEQWAVQSNAGLLVSQTATDIHLGATDNGPPVTVTGGTLPLGSTVHDSAIVAGPAGEPKPTGTVTFTFYTNGTGTPPGTSAGAVTLVNGVADPSAVESNLMAGSYSFTAHYSGDSNYAPSDSPVETLTISKGASFGTTTILDAATNKPPTGTFGESVIDTASGGVSPAAFTPTGTVTYTFTGTNGTSLAGLTAPSSWTVSADKLTWTETVTLNATAPFVPNSDPTGPLPTGSYAFTGSYSGDPNYTGVTGTVEPLNIGPGVSNTQTAILDAATKQTFTGPLGDSVVDSATVTGNPTPTSGSVTYTFTGTNGTSLANVTPGSSSWTVSADKLTWTETVPLDATTGTVPNSDPTGPLPAGNYQFQASYSGVTGVITGSTSEVEPMTIRKGISFGQTTILDEVTNGPPTGALGESVFDTATGRVSPAAFTPTGTVTYTFTGTNGTSLANLTPPASSSWKVSADRLTWTETVTLNATATPPVPNSDVTGALPGGSYVFQATYSGDSNYEGLTSDFELLDIGPGASITQTTILDAVSNGPPTGFAGESVFDTATVTGTPPAFTPTGTVTYTFTGTGGTSLAGLTPGSSNWTVSADQLTWTETVPLNADGTAPPSDVTGALPPGAYAFTEFYNSGDNNFTDSTSAVEPLNISKAIPVITTIPNPTTALVGQTLQDTADLTGGLNPTGSIVFTLYAPGVDPTVGPAAYTETVPGVNGNGTYHTSVGFVPPATGIWHWVAAYIGDSNNTSVSSGPLDEAVTVVPTGFPDLLPDFEGKVSLLGSNYTPDPLTLLPDALFVNGLYHDILGRVADQAGVNSWVMALQMGVSPQAVASDFWESAEHRGLEVDAFYQTLLHRAADPVGSAGWVNALVAGASETQVELAFLMSPEYQADHPGAAAYITGLYTDVLRRAPAAAEMAFWVQRLQAGASPQEVALGFLTSPEAAGDAVQALYQQALRRPADPVGLAALTPLLQAGAPWEVGADALFASPEYFNLPH